MLPLSLLRMRLELRFGFREVEFRPLALARFRMYVYLCLYPSADIGPKQFASQLRGLGQFS